MGKPAGANRVLVVEDEPAICDVCQRVLAGEGFEVDIAVNGEIAQDMIEEKRYDLCLVDIRTPAMSGNELYRWLRGRYPKVANRVIFTTGDVMGRDTQSFLEQANRPFLAKPFTLKEITAVIKETLEELKNDKRRRKGSGC